MSPSTSYILVICGSPRKQGVSARYAEHLKNNLQAQGRDVRVWRVSDHCVQGCIGCQGCRGGNYTCIIKDDMQELYDLLATAERVELVFPVYFAGPTAQAKAVLDRLQPLWERRRGPQALPGAAQEPKRPVRLHVLGAGGDPFGFGPLEINVRSAFGAAGFTVTEVLDRIGWGQPEAEAHKDIFEPIRAAAPDGSPESPDHQGGAHNERTCS